MLEAAKPILPEFDRPQVVETVLSAQFDPLAKMRAVHFGLFWQRVRDQFPTTEEKPALEPVFERFGDRPKRGPRLRPINVQVRVVAATNRNLEDMVQKEKFREDLYYRLCVMPIRVPPLRERPGDIRALAAYFLDEFCRRNNFRAKCLEEETVEILEEYHWPGNARGASQCD